MRGWAFRIALLLNLGVYITAYVFTRVSMFGFPYFKPGVLEIPSSYPYIGILYSNIILAVAGSLVAADLIDREKSLDSNEAVFSRRFSMLEYLAGKGAALFFIFLVHIVAVLAVTLVYNLVFIGSGVSWNAYLLYPFLICLPTFVFFTGTAMFLQSITGNRALTLTALVGLLAVLVVLAPGRLYYTFDAAAFGLPVLLSEYTGLSAPLLTAAQRASFLLAGLAMTAAAVLLLGRPRQSRSSSSILAASVPVLAAASIVLTSGYLRYHTDGSAMRADMMAAAERLRAEPVATPVSFDIQLEHDGRDLEIITAVVIRNDTAGPLNSYLFNLNPGLKVDSVVAEGSGLRFTRDMQVLEIYPQRALQPEGHDTVTVACSGTIDDRACFPDADEDERWRGFSYIDDSMFDRNPDFFYRHSRFKFRKQFSWAQDDQLLLPPYTMWYPAPGLVRGSQDPGLEYRFFAVHKLSVRTREGLMAVAQGSGTRTAPGLFEFLPGEPLPGMTLTAGRYSNRSAEVDSVTYSLSTLCPDDYFMPFFISVADTIPSLIRELREWADSETGLEYPFARLAIVEAPANLYCFARPLVTNGKDYSQPGIIMAPERGFDWSMGFLYYMYDSRFRGTFSWSSEDPRTRKSRSFVNTLRNSILDAGQYIPVSSYYSGIFHIGSTGRSALDHAVESHFAGRLDYWLDIDKKYEPGTGGSPGLSWLSTVQTFPIFSLTGQGVMPLSMPCRSRESS